MDAFFNELGTQVLARWKRENFSLEKFPEIARVALEERPPSEHVDLSVFIQEFLLNDEQPLQTQSGFGQPELVAYDHPRFYIQILVWMDGTTDIHQHEFSGAFHVLSGSSIHAHYAFEKAQFPCWARGINLRGPYKDGPGAVNIPVSIGGLIINPGDIVLGDSDGVVAFSPKVALEVAQLGKEKVAQEVATLKSIKDGTYNDSWIDTVLKAKGC